MVLCKEQSAKDMELDKAGASGLSIPGKCFFHLLLAWVSAAASQLNMQPQPNSWLLQPS